jgi:formylmethanofuran dehydrogenase subunit E
MHNLNDCLRASEAHHHQLCPRQVLGARMGLLAGRLLELELPRRDKRLLVIFEIDGCSVDGVMAATGCSPGHRTLRVEDYGKLAGTFVDTPTGKAVRLVPHPQARARAAALSSGASTRWQAQLIGYQCLRDEELFLAQPVALIIPLEHLISHSGARARCEGCGEEILNERQLRFGDSTVCRACAGEAYYRVVPGGPEGAAISNSLRHARGVSPSEQSVSSRLEEERLATLDPAGEV